MIPQTVFVTQDENEDENSNNHTPFFDENVNDNSLYHLDTINSSTGMTESQKEELAILLMNELNHAREARGLQPFTMSEKKFQQAQVRASQSSAANLDHNTNDEIAAFGNEQYECLSSFDSADNMLSLLYNATRSMSSMLNADSTSQWGHRENFLNPDGGDAAFGFQYHPETDNYTFTFDYNGNSDGTTANMMDRISQYESEGPITASTTTIDNTAKINDLNNQINRLDSQISSLQKQARNLQNQIDSLKQQSTSFDESELDSTTKAKYEQAKKELSSAVAKVNAAQANLEKINDQISTSQHSVNNLTDKLNTAKANLSQAQSQLAKDQQALSELKATHGTQPSTGDNSKSTSDDNSKMSDGNTGSNTNTDSKPSTGDDSKSATDNKSQTSHDGGSTTDTNSTTGSKTNTGSDSDHNNAQQSSSSDTSKSTSDDPSHNTTSNSSTTTNQQATSDSNKAADSQVVEKTNGERNGLQSQFSKANSLSTTDLHTLSTSASSVETPVAQTTTKSDANKVNKGTLPQTGNANRSLALVGLGTAAMASMLGLSIMNKRHD